MMTDGHAPDQAPDGAAGTSDTAPADAAPKNTATSQAVAEQAAPEQERAAPEQAGAEQAGAEQGGSPRAQVRRAARRKRRHRLIGLGVAVVVLAAIYPLARATTGPAVAEPGTRAPNFTLPGLRHPGHAISLSHYAGEPVIINFFSSWSPPSISETELLGHFFRHAHGKVLILGIDARDSRAAALRLLRTQRAAYPVAADPTLNVANRYGVPGLPATFFLDSRHEVVDTDLGWLNWRKIRRGVRAMRSGTLLIKN